MSCFTLLQVFFEAATAPLCEQGKNSKTGGGKRSCKVWPSRLHVVSHSSHVGSLHGELPFLSTHWQQIRIQTRLIFLRSPTYVNVCLYKGLYSSVVVFVFLPDSEVRSCSVNTTHCTAPAVRSVSVRCLKLLYLKSAQLLDLTHSLLCVLRVKKEATTTRW